MSFNISPCPSRLQEYIVQMDVINKGLKSLKLRQLSSVGSEWQISLIESIQDIIPSGNLASGQSLSCFLKLKVINWLDYLYTTFITFYFLINYFFLQNAKTTETATDVWLGRIGNEAVFDTQRAPLVNFHHYEQLHQKTSHKVR